MQRTALISLIFLALPGVARADYREGEVPEGGNASTLRAGEKRIALIGPTGIGITDHTELTTSLMYDLVLFPNLQLEHRFADGEVSASWSVGVGAGALPVAGGGVLPLPGAIIGVAGVGIVAAAEEHAKINVTWHPVAPIALSATVGAFALEGGFTGLVGGVGVGGGGAAGGVVPVAGGSSRGGPLAGLEVAATLGPRDAILVAVDAYKFSPWVQGGASGLIYARASWTHAWERFALSLGAYTLADPPHYQTIKDSKLPVGPFMNVAWSWR
jgi:hypothetical protein